MRFDRPIIVHLERGDKELFALESVLGWHGPDDLSTEEWQEYRGPYLEINSKHPNGRHSGQVTIRLLVNRAPVDISSFDSAREWLNLLTEDAKHVLDTYTPHLNSTDETGFGSVAKMAELLVETRQTELRHIEAARKALTDIESHALSGLVAA